MFEKPTFQEDPDEQNHVGLHHFAFQYNDLDELLGTYVRLKDLGIEPVVAVDEDVQISSYYNDPEHNRVELNVNNYGNEWTAAQRMRDTVGMSRRGEIDPEKLLGARKARASHWELHQRAIHGEFTPEKSSGH